MKISILNSGQENNYLFGLVLGLSRIPSIEIDVIDSVSSVGLFDSLPNTTFYNLRGDNLSRQPLIKKARCIGLYYIKLIAYAASTNSEIFHIQWENSIAVFDRIFLNLYYKLLGKKLVFTAHNVFREERDGRSNFFRRFSQKMMYRLVDRIIVHTVKMKEELCSLFDISPEKVFVIQHGPNIRISRKDVAREEARKKLCIDVSSHVVLFFGQIDEYKGLDLLVDSIQLLVKKDPSVLLLIAGKPKRNSGYLRNLFERIEKTISPQNAVKRYEFIPVDEVEIYFAAADCLVLPYRKISQSGVMFLAYRFGTPIIATDTGSFREDVVDGVTGLICRKDDHEDMAAKIESFFESKLFNDREKTRTDIIRYAEDKYSWTDIAKKTYDVYLDLAERK